MTFSIATNLHSKRCKNEVEAQLTLLKFNIDNNTSQHYDALLSLNYTRPDIELGPMTYKDVKII